MKLPYPNISGRATAPTYLQALPPFGHTQNQPYNDFSIASKKYRHTYRAHGESQRLLTTIP